MTNKTIIYLGALACLFLTGCQDRDDLAGETDVTLNQIIRIGGISTDGLVAQAAVTRTDPPAVDEETVQRTDAENISWLRTPLEQGLDITYGNYDSDWHRIHERVAVLTLLTENGEIKYSVDGSNKYAEYSFLYRDDQDGHKTDDPAIWYDNGAHFFEGLYVPSEIQYTSNDASDVYDATNGTAKSLTTDQHDDNTTKNTTTPLGNYTLLSRYLSMPSGFTLNATVARIKLPFRHRLARVLAYILIDPDMGSGISIEGYKKDENGIATTDEDPTNTKIRFCNVKVLAGVKDSYNSVTQHHTYTPQWMQARKVIPHFVGERGSYDDSGKSDPSSLNDDHFIAYYNTQKKEYIYPTDAEWKTINTTFPAITGSETETDNIVGDYERTIYGKVPVYDLIVQPTYTDVNRVMYDEEGVTNISTKQSLYEATNQIDFEITLNNGLHYTKQFEFDLDANYQTVVYLHISHERVDYDSSGSELWVESIGYDDYYGVNNENGNTLSYAGSSWQRAYTCGTLPAGTEHPSDFVDRVTDGHFYTWDGEDRYAQYVTDARWIEMLCEAYEDGKHHGDYFILHHDISIPAAAFPPGFVFTGHLDGQDHTITLTDASYTPAHDEYEPYTTASDTKYVEVSTGNYAVFTPDPSATYCDANHDVISDINSYSGSTAYIRTVASTTYQVVPVGSSYNDGPYYDNNHDPITDISTYLSAKGTIYTKDADSYTAVDINTLSPSGTDYYYDDGSNYVEINDINTYIGIYREVINYHYELIAFYKFVHYEPVIGSSTGTTGLHLFSGLNGKYSTDQESDDSQPWEANVHREKVGNTVYWVPYTNGTDGWRAEIINTNITGGTLFPTNAVYGTDITGYVHNCWINGTFSGTPPKWSGTKVQEYTPSLPEY